MGCYRSRPVIPTELLWNWNDFVDAMIGAHHNKWRKFKVTLTLTIEYCDGGEETINYIVSHVGTVNRRTLNNIQFKLFHFMYQPFYYVHDYIYYYPNVSNCTFKYVKDIVFNKC